VRASYGTLQLLGLKAGEFPWNPRTAFLLIGNKCSGVCSFCPQAKGESDFVSRITWPVLDESDLFLRLPHTKLDRICIQGVKEDKVLEEVLNLLIRISQISKAPISVSIYIESLDQAEGIFEAGANNVSLAIDCSSERVSQEIKGQNLSKLVDMLKTLAKSHPGRVTTHLMMGLGETEQELVELARNLIKSDINVSLFAFTPLQGTPLENLPQPSIRRYRIIQAILAVLRKNNDWEIVYENGIIKNYGQVKAMLEPSDFQTPGCKGCNRPFYNEKPGTKPYNFPNPPDLEDVFCDLEGQ